MNLSRSAALVAVLGLVTGARECAAAQSSRRPGDPMSSTESTVFGVHDFDFFVGHWQVHHRRLKERLANNNDWIEFQGTTVTRKVMGGYANIDDNVLEYPGGSYRAITLRSFDPSSRQWSIWWLDSRSPKGPLDPPIRGGFHNGVGTFYADDTFKGKPIRVRFIWSGITPKSCHWEQAFSGDQGATWETNWEMDFVRTR